jgi:DNA-binding MarR family transcriptional regulator
LDRDHVDHVRDQWTKVRPELDTSPFAVVGRVGRVASFLDRGVERVLAGYGLDRSSWDILASLRRHGPPFRLSPTELYRDLMRTSGAMTYRLHQLERAGLVERVLDPGDRRSTLVALTAAGQALVDAVAPIHMENERHLLAALSGEEQETLAALLRKLLVAYERESPGKSERGEAHAHRRRRAKTVWV